MILSVQFVLCFSDLVPSIGLEVGTEFLLPEAKGPGLKTSDDELEGRSCGMSDQTSEIERSPLLGISKRVFLVRLSHDLRVNKAWICPPIQLARTSERGHRWLDRLIRRTSISAVLAAPCLAWHFSWLAAAVKVEFKEADPEDKQNIA